MFNDSKAVCAFIKKETIRFKRTDSAGNFTRHQLQGQWKGGYQDIYYKYTQCVFEKLSSVFLSLF